MKDKTLWFSAFLLLTAATFPTYKNLGLPAKVFPTTSSYYTVTEISEDPASPGFLKFHLTTPHGPYEEEGLVNLRKAQFEIEALETLVESEKQGGFKEGFAESIEDTKVGLIKFRDHPKESMKDMREAGSKIGHMIGEAIREKDPGEKTTLSEMVLGSTKRELAKQMGVDVYSRNPYLQKRLDDMARKQMEGKGAAMAGRMMLPIGKIASFTLAAGSLNRAADKLVTDINREELFQMNRAALFEAGYAEEPVRALLNHPYWTPREVTYLRYYFEKLKGVAGASALLEAAGKPKEGMAAYRFLHEVQMAAEKFNGNPKDSKIRSYPEGMALKQGEKLFWITAYDYLDDGDPGKKAIEKAGMVKKEWRCQSIEILNGGKVTAAFLIRSLMHGVPSQEMVLFG